MRSCAGPWALLSGSTKLPRAEQAVSPASSVGKSRQNRGWRRWDPMSCSGPARGSPSEPSHPGWDQHPVPCSGGAGGPRISAGLCDTCPKGSKWALPTKFLVLEGAPRYIHIQKVRFFLKFFQKVRFFRLSNSGTAAPGATFCFLQGVHFPCGSWLGAWQHLRSTACPAAAPGQARSSGHGVGRGRAAPPCPPRAEGSAERKLLLTELRALPDWG